MFRVSPFGGAAWRAAMRTGSDLPERLLVRQAPFRLQDSVAACEIAVSLSEVTGLTFPK